MSLFLARKIKFYLIFIFFLITSILPVFSQEASGLSLGKPLETLREPGEVYLAGNKGDWNVRCVTGNSGEIDKCEIQQLLFLNENTSIADISHQVLLRSQVVYLVISLKLLVRTRVEYL